MLLCPNNLVIAELVIGRKFELETIPGFSPSKKAAASLFDAEEYSDFEADPQPRGRGKPKRRRSR